MNPRHALMLFAAAALPALPATAQTMSGATFVAKAGASDLYERQSSMLVEKSTANAKLKGFAQHMVTDHTKSTADVKAAAKRAGMKPAAPRLDAEQSANMAKLRAASGTARDTMYIDQQKAAHADALALHQGYAENGKVAPLKAAASKIAPVVQSHIDMLNGM